VSGPDGAYCFTAPEAGRLRREDHRAGRPHQHHPVAITNIALRSGIDSLNNNFASRRAPA